MPKDIKIKCASCGYMNSEEIEDISEIGVQKIIERVRNGEYSSLFLSPDEYGDFEYLKLETSEEMIFLQILDEESWSCYDPKHLDSDEIAPFEVDDNFIDLSVKKWLIRTENMYLGEGLPEMKYAIQDWDLAAKCVEWYIHTLEPYPGANWLKLA